jgi:hypothetical protein
MKAKLHVIGHVFGKIKSKLSSDKKDIKEITKADDPLLLATADSIQIVRNIYDGRYNAEKYQKDRKLTRAMVANALNVKVEKLEKYLDAHPGIEPQLGRKNARINELELQVEVLARIDTLQLDIMKKIAAAKKAAPEAVKEAAPEAVEEAAIAVSVANSFAAREASRNLGSTTLSVTPK